ncbi:MAG: shikimate dehydrogenase [Chitinophagales bacterium]
MREFGLIGLPLAHSFSKKYFEEKFLLETIADCSYNLFPLKNIQELPSLLKLRPQIVGLNVTIPYKESVIPFLKSFTQEVEKIGAVNCIKVVDNQMHGYNTDVTGFEISLNHFLNHTPEKIFVLGTGGSSKAVCFVLRKLKMDFLKVSRAEAAGQILYHQIESHLGGSNLYINTTPLGMFPQLISAPEIPYDQLTPKDFLFDLVYNPTETEFLKRGKLRGAETKNGLEMLELQAEKSWEIWNNKSQSW